MWKKAIIVSIIAWLGYLAYDYYNGPFYDAPPLKEGEFRLAFKGERALRGVMRGIGDRDRTRRYISYEANNVRSWYEATWSICRKPKDEEVTVFKNNVDMGPGGRLDAICEIDADGDVFVRGWIGSVPEL